MQPCMQGWMECVNGVQGYIEGWSAGVQLYIEGWSAEMECRDAARQKRNQVQQCRGL